MQYLKDKTYRFDPNKVIDIDYIGKTFVCERIADGQKFILITKSKKNKNPPELFKELEKNESITQKLADNSNLPFFLHQIEEFEDSEFKYKIKEFFSSSLEKELTHGPFSEERALDYVFQVALGISYLHSRQITLRNLKPDNLVLQGDRVMMADFSFAGFDVIMDVKLGTPIYMAPEQLAKGEQIYTSKIDVWALNVVLYNLLTNEYYFYANNLTELSKQVIEKKFVIGPKTTHLKAQTQDLLARGFIKNPNHRPSIDQYINHPAFDFLRGKYAKYLIRWPADPYIEGIDLNPLENAY